VRVQAVERTWTTRGFTTYALRRKRDVSVVKQELVDIWRGHDAAASDAFKGTNDG
jgi:hypothetical protein